jgi:hypothetical protein
MSIRAVTKTVATNSPAVIMGSKGFQSSELFGSQQRVGEIEQQPCSHDSGEGIIEDHRSASLQTVTGIGVAHGKREKAQSHCQHDDVRHLVSPDDRSPKQWSWPAVSSICGIEKVIRMDRMATS